ncbi:hypothetical protein ES703_105055 [subsurface metagenome]
MDAVIVFLAFIAGSISFEDKVRNRFYVVIGRAYFGYGPSLHLML